MHLIECCGFLLAGHGWDVKSVDWHPQKALLVSGGLMLIFLSGGNNEHLLTKLVAVF